MKFAVRLALFTTLTCLPAAGAARFVTPEVVLDITGADITGRSLRGGATFSLSEVLKRDFGPRCTGTLTVTPLSLVGDLLSLQVQGDRLAGQGCQAPGQQVKVYRIGTSPGASSQPPTLSRLVGESTLVTALRADPYLRQHWQLSGTTLPELDQVLTRQPFYNADECRLAPAPLGTGNFAFAFWQQAGSTLKVRLALPFLCDVDPPTPDFLWLGVNVPLPAALRRDVQAARQGRGFLGSAHPRTTVTIHLKAR